MKCPLCNADTKEDFVRIKRVINSQQVIIVDVPSLKCQNIDCQEILLHSPVVKRMRSLINDIRERKFQEEQLTYKDYYNYNEVD